MGKREEQVAEIEAALRHRFFPHVVGLDRTERVERGENPDDTNVLSRCLAAYGLLTCCAIDDITAVGAITDGSDDGGIDALYFDRNGPRLLFVQSKFKRGGAAPALDDTLKTLAGVRALQARRFQQFNQSIQNRRDDIEEALDTPGITLCVIFVFLGDNLGLHATLALDNFCDELNQTGSITECRTVGLDTLYARLVEEQSPRTVFDKLTLENWAGVTTPFKAYYGQVRATELARLVTTHGTALFEHNIRHYLGSIGVNVAIERTVRAHPDRLFYLNNGITGVASTIVPAAGNQTRRVFGVKDFSIVNGAQTAGAITNALRAGAISEEAKVMITIVELGEDSIALGLAITRARNHQTNVQGSDFAALDPNQERLRRELAAMGITYHYRPSVDARVPRGGAFTLEEAAIALACLKFRIMPNAERSRNPITLDAIDFVVTAKGAIGRLWEQESEHYRQLFSSDLLGLRLYRLVQIYRFIDNILGDTERSENDSTRKSFFRHARHFVIAFVALRSTQVVARHELTLSQEDRAYLSRCTNDLYELIYAESASMQAFKGYLAIFRNLTDSRQLADAVLQRLVELDAPPTA